MDSVASAPQTADPAPNPQLLAAYQDWCKVTNTPQPIQSRTITKRIESYIAYCVEQLDDEMTWRDLKSLARGLKAMVVEQLGWEPESATLAMFDIKIKNLCWKLSTKHGIDSTSGKALQINCDMEETGEMRHSVELSSSQDSFDGHVSQMEMYKFMGVSSKIKLADLIKKPQGTSGTANATASSSKTNTTIKAPKKKRTIGSSVESAVVSGSTSGNGKASGTKRQSDALEPAGLSIPTNIESSGSGFGTQGIIVQAGETIEQTSVDLVAREGLDMGVTSEQTQATIVGQGSVSNGDDWRKTEVQKHETTSDNKSSATGPHVPDEQDPQKELDTHPAEDGASNKRRKLENAADIQDQE